MPTVDPGAQSPREQCGSVPRHIVFVLQGLGAGGSEHIVSQLCNHLVVNGWRVTLLAFEEPTTSPYYAHDPAVRIVTLGLKPQRRGALAATVAMIGRGMRLRRAFVALKPDLVVSFLTRPNILSVIAAQGLDLPVIVSERNNPELQTVGPVWERLRRWSYRRANGLVTMTQGAMRYFDTARPRNRWVIPNPATLPTSIAMRQSDGRTIGAVGRLVPQKGFDLLLLAFARVAAVLPEWRLVIWGEGAERATLERERDRLGLSERVEMPGVTTRPGEWIARSDLFVLSSRFEGWGIVVGEAMAGGLPVISFDCPFGPSEMIEHDASGILVAPGDVDALANALIALCTDPVRRQTLGAAARERMKAFGPDQVFAQWCAAIEETIVRPSNNSTEPRG